MTQKRRFKSSVASTEREAHSLVHAMLAELDSATKVDQVAATSQTVGRLIERWLEVAGPAAPSTRSVYAGYIKNQIRPHLWEIRLDRLGVADLDCWYVTLRKNGLKPASIRKVHTIVRAALAQGVRWGWTSVNVAAMARPPVVPKPVIVTPKAVDVKHLVAVVDETDPEFATYIRLAGVTGARPGELCALQWGDVDFATGELFVRRRVMRSDDGMFVEDLTKTGKVRRIPLDPSTLARLVNIGSWPTSEQRQPKRSWAMAAACSRRRSTELSSGGRTPYLDGSEPSVRRPAGARRRSTRCATRRPRP